MDVAKAAVAFQKDASPAADDAVYQARVDRTNRTGTEVPVAGDNAPTPATGQFFRYCYECHNPNGLASAIDPGNLKRFVGKYQHRTVANLLGREMPPTGIDQALYNAIRDTVGEADATSR